MDIYIHHGRYKKLLFFLNLIDSKLQMKKLLFLMILTILFSCDTAEDYHNQALSNCELENYNEAINNFNKAIDLNPNLQMLII